MLNSAVFSLFGDFNIRKEEQRKNTTLGQFGGHVILPRPHLNFQIKQGKDSNKNIGG